MATSLNFGEKHVVLNNGDIFIAQMPETPSVKDYLASICANMQITCKLYNRLQDSAYHSFSEEIMLKNEVPSSFIMKVKPWHRQFDLMNELAAYITRGTCPA